MISGIKGKVILRENTHEYEEFARGKQYASQYIVKADVMRPAMIVVALDDDDVHRTIQYARKNGLAIAVRTGGHHYMGMSSTGGENIQLDVGRTYMDKDTSRLEKRKHLDVRYFVVVV